MRKPLLMAATMAATASMLVATSTMAWAATPKAAVLTYTKVKGTNITNGQVLSAALAPKKSLTAGFAVSFFGTAVDITLTCSQATFSTTVAKNPAAGTTAKPATAAGTKTSLTVPTADCKATTNLSGVDITVNSVKFTFASTIDTTFSDAKGLPVSVAPTTTTADPVEITLAVNAPVIGAVTCNWSATKLAGSESNTGPLLTLNAQAVTTAAPGQSDGPCSPAFDGPITMNLSSAAFGPFNDASATVSKAHPHVYVN
jgi:hypothetical protein